MRETAEECAYEQPTGWKTVSILVSTPYPLYAVAVIVPVFEEKGFTSIIHIYLKIW